MAGGTGSWLHAEGDVWAIGFDGTVVRVKDSKGLRYLAELLTSPGTEIHALDLVRRLGGPLPAEPGVAPKVGDAGPVLDDRARAEYRRRLTDLQEEVDEATAFNDPARAERAQDEMDFLLRELSGAFGLGGRARLVGSDAERARVAVRRAIKAALERITDASKELGEHLEATVRTGTYCVYRPDPRTAPWSRGPHTETGPSGLPTGVVSFLLTDIVDSTRMWEEDPSAMAEALATHDRLIAVAVADAGGVLIKSKGEGDSTLSVFARATDGVTAAVAAQQSLAGEAWPGALEIDVRMALHSGEAHERDGDYFGPTVNRAARLRSIAAGRQVVVSGAAAELIQDGLPAGVTLIPAGARRLRGLSREESYFVLAGPSLVSDLPGPAVDPVRAPLPLPLLAGERRFGGRPSELERLDRAWRDVAGGALAAVFLAGEPGIGKSALAAEFARRVHAHGGEVLFGRCEEDLDMAYQPFAEAIRPYLAGCDPATLGDPAIRPAARLARLEPAPGPSTDSGTDRLTLFESVATVLRRAARTAPILVVLDDLHWAAKPTALLLGHLLRAAEPIAMLIVGTYRDTELAPSNPLAELLADLRRHDRVERVRLSGLGLTDTCALIEADATAPLAAREREFAEAAHRRSQGNPLFARELYRHFAETGGTQEHLPDGVMEVIGHRLLMLPAATTRALSVAALIGDRFKLDVLERVPDAADDADGLLAALEAGLGSKLIEEVDGPAGFAFTHGLVRETLAAQLSGARRARLHHRIGAAIESLPGRQRRFGEMAYHYAEGAAHDCGAKAAVIAVMAGHEALDRLAYEQAVAVLERGIDVVGAHGDAIAADARLALLLAAVRAHFLDHDPQRCTERATEAAALALQIDDLDGWGRAHLYLARARSMHDPRSVGRPADSGPLEEFLARTTDQQSSLRIEVLLYLAEVRFASFEFDRGLALAGEALALAERTGDQAAGAKAARAAGLNHLGQLELGDAAEQFLASARQMPSSVDPYVEAHARSRLALVRLIQGALEEADAEAAVAGELTRPIDQGDYSLTVSCRAAIATTQGRFDDAEAFGLEGERAFERSRYAFAAPVLFPAWACGRALRGDSAGASEILDRWAQTGGRGAWRYHLLVQVLAGTGDQPPPGLPALRAHARDRSVDLFAVPSLAAEADIGDLAGIAEPLTGAYPRLREARGKGVVFCLGWTLFVPRLLGVAATALGRYDEARGWLAEAQALAATVSPVEEARNLEANARLLLAEGGSEARARDLLERAARAFDDLGVLALLGRATDLGGSLTGFSFRPALRYVMAIDSESSLGQAERAVIRDHLYSWQGVPFTAGDDPHLVARFDSVAAAVSCAADIHAEHDVSATAPGLRSHVRIGIAVGRPSGRGSDLFGTVTSAAVAIAESAPPGGTCLSEDAERARAKTPAWT